MAGDSLRLLIVKTLLALTILEALLTAVFEAFHMHHETNKWIAGLTATVLTIVVRNSFRKKKDCDKSD